MGPILDLTSAEDLYVLAFGSGDIGLDGARHFLSEVQRLLALVQSTDRSNPIERQEAKQEFIVLMRDSMWIPTLACIAYTLFVHVGPRVIRKPWPVRLLSPVPPALSPSRFPPT